MEGMQIDEESLRKLHVNIGVFESAVLKSAQQALSEYGMRIVARAKAILKENDNVVTGFLRNSGRTVVNDDGTVDAGFEADYAGDIEYGRKSGTRPPIENIYQWLVKKRIFPKKRGESKDMVKERYALARSIVNKIYEKGTKAYPFLSKAYNEFKDEINKYMQGVVDATVQAFNKI